MTIRLEMRDGTTKEIKNAWQLNEIGGMLMIPRGRDYTYDITPSVDVRQVHIFHLDEEVNEQTRISDGNRSESSSGSN